VAESGLLR